MPLLRTYLCSPPVSQHIRHRRNWGTLPGPLLSPLTECRHFARCDGEMRRRSQRVTKTEQTDLERVWMASCNDWQALVRLAPACVMLVSSQGLSGGCGAHT